MNKRLFQILDEMNVNDELNKTDTCGCCFDLVATNKVKAGGHVTMGVPAEAVLRIFTQEYQPVLVLLNKKEYDRIEKQPVESAEQRADRYEKALKAIRDWQLPSTGRFWDDGVTPMSYESCYGSNGVRDYFKALANEALTPKQNTDDTE